MLYSSSRGSGPPDRLALVASPTEADLRAVSMWSARRGLAENEHLNAGFESLKLRQLYRSALKDQKVATENVAYFHEYLTDSIASGDARGALEAIMSWGKNAAVRVRRILEEAGTAAPGDLRPGGIVEDLSIGFAKDQENLAGDVDALVQALDIEVEDCDSRWLNLSPGPVRSPECRRYRQQANRTEPFHVEVPFVCHFSPFPD